MTGILAGRRLDLPTRSIACGLDFRNNTMSVQPLNSAIHEQARMLAADNRLAQPDIVKILWFPDDHEVRLVELTEEVSISSEGDVLPFYFRPAPRLNLPAPTAIALIRPEELGRLRLPSGWGDWSDAVEL